MKVAADLGHNSTNPSPSGNEAQIASTLGRLTTEMMHVQRDETALILFDDIAQMREFLKEIDDRLQNITTLSASLHELIPNHKMDIQRLVTAWEAYLTLHHKVREITLQNGTALSTALALGKNNELMERLNSIVIEIVDRNKEMIIVETKHADNIYNEARNELITIALFAIAIGIGVALWISFSIRNGLRKSG